LRRFIRLKEGPKLKIWVPQVILNTQSATMGSLLM
jgi:hypothetical protein